MTTLRYVHDDEPGITRRRAGKGFVYLAPSGTRITADGELTRIKSLAIPPAWTDVWISPEAAGHLQATGRDARGRKQYRYHADWRAEQETKKFDRMIEFGGALPHVRRRIAQDYKLPGLPHDKVVASVVHLLEASLIRVGNEEYARTNGSFGLTTLRDPHVAVARSGDINFAFPGKSNQKHHITINDPRTARIVAKCRDLPGQRLFQYEDEAGELRAVGSSDVNDYLRAATDADFTAKDFRTWIGTLLAASALAALDPPTSERGGRHDAAAAIEVVAQRLGNTPTVARNSYVHPDVVDLYVEGSLPEIWTGKPARDSRWMLAEERRLLTVLRTARRRARAGAGAGR